MLIYKLDHYLHFTQAESMFHNFKELTPKSIKTNLAQTYCSVFTHILESNQTGTEQLYN